LCTLILIIVGGAQVVEVKFLNFGHLLSTSGETESSPTSGNFKVSEDSEFVNALAIQFGALAEKLISPGNDIGALEEDITSFLEEGGIISPLPAEIYRQLPNDDSVGSLIYPINFSVPQTENPGETFDLQKQPQLPSEYNPRHSIDSIEIKSNPSTVLTEKFSLVADEIKNFTGKPLDTVIESAGFNRENISGNAPLSENKIHITQLSKPFGQPNWNHEFGDRIIWLINKSHSFAELRLNPPNLGTIEVKVHALQDQTNIAFSSQNAQVREVLESTIPRLREMLGAQQIELKDVFVDQHSFGSHGGTNSNRQFFDEQFTPSSTDDIAENIKTSGNISDEEILTSEGVLSLYV